MHKITGKLDRGSSPLSSIEPLRVVSLRAANSYPTDVTELVDVPDLESGWLEASVGSTPTICIHKYKTKDFVTDLPIIEGDWLEE